MKVLASTDRTEIFEHRKFSYPQEMILVLLFGEIKHCFFSFLLEDSSHARENTIITKGLALTQQQGDREN